MTPFWPPTVATAPRPPSRRPIWKWPSSGPAGATSPGGPRPPGRSGWAFESHVVTVDAYDALAAASAEAGEHRVGPRRTDRGGAARDQRRRRGGAAAAGLRSRRRRADRPDRPRRAAAGPHRARGGPRAGGADAGPRRRRRLVRDDRGERGEFGDPASPAHRGGAGRRRLRQNRLRRPGRRLSLRHDPHLRTGQGRRLAAGDIRAGQRPRSEPAGLRWKPEPAWPTWMRRRAR